MRRTVTYLWGLSFVLSVLGGSLSACHAPWGGPPDWEQAFPQDKIGEWRLTLSEENWLRLIVDPASQPCQSENLGPGCATDTDCPLGCDCLQGTCRTNYVEAELEVDGIKFPQVGLSITGNRRAAKENFRVRFNLFRPGQRFFGLARVNLRNNEGDPTLIREKLALELFRAAGLCAPRAAFAWVSVNAETRGLYTLVEPVDRKLLEDCFGEDRGNLYRLHAGADLVWQGNDPARYWPPFAATYQKQTNERSENVDDLLRLMEILTSPAVEDGLESVLDLDEFLSALAINSWLANLDSYPGTGDNVFLYRDAAGRFRYLPWDLKRAFGNYHGEACDFSTDELLALDLDAPTCGDPRPLVDNVLAVTRFRERYHRRLGELRREVLDPQAVLKRAEHWHRFIKERALSDKLKGFSDQQFDQALQKDTPPGTNPVRVPGIGPFVQARDQVLSRIVGR